jgi:hypothetical protein
MQISCPVCGPLDGEIIKIESAPIFPMEPCTCDTANFGYAAQMDFLAEWND